MTKTIAGFFFLLLPVASVHAQLPPGELPLHPPAHAKWSIVYSKTDAAAMPKPSPTKPGKRLAEADYEITDNIAHLTEIFAGGVRQQMYIVDGLSFVDDLANKEIKAMPVDPERNQNAGFQRVYPGFEWVQKSHYVDTVEKGGAHLLHFSETPAKPGREAWMDADTGLPVYFQVGTQIGVYRFSPPPTEKIKLDPAFEKAFKVYNGYQ